MRHLLRQGRVGEHLVTSMVDDPLLLQPGLQSWFGRIRCMSVSIIAVISINGTEQPMILGRSVTGWTSL